MGPDITRAYLMVRLSAIAYLTDYNAISLGVAELGLEFIAVVEVDGFQTLIAREPGKSNIVVFRGTPVTCGRNINDAVQALAVDAGLSHVTARSGGRILAGVYYAVLRNWGKISHYLDDDLPISITGHSLGATEALAAVAFVPRTIKTEVIVFAPFQFADAEFLKAVYDGRDHPLIFGAENDFALGHDHLDPVTVFFGPVIRLMNDGSMESVTDWPLYRESVADHAVENYVAKIERLVA